MAYSAWSAGRTLAGQHYPRRRWHNGLPSPPATALLGLAWIMFGRTRRRETERFTRSVIAMRAETQSLGGVLEVFPSESKTAKHHLTGMTNRLMQLGDGTTGRFDGISPRTRRLVRALSRSGEGVDRAANRRARYGGIAGDLPKRSDDPRIAGICVARRRFDRSRTADLGPQ